MKPLIRIKTTGCCVIEFDPTDLKSFCITDEYDNPEGDYVLMAMSDKVEYVLHVGTFDSCHLILNKVHDIIGVELIDLR